MIIKKIFTLCATSIFLGACSTYRLDPVDLGRDTAEWKALSERISSQGRRLSKEQMQSIGLLLNPDLNAARLSFAKSTAAAKYAGLWDDPSLSGDIERVLKENVFNGSVGLSVAIPLTGIPKLQKLVAEQYEEGEYWQMREKERVYLAELNSLRYELMLIHRKQELMRTRLKALREEKNGISRLFDLGEVDFAELQLANQRLSDTIKDEQELASDHNNKHLQLRKSLGLHPGVGELELAGSLPTGVPSLQRVPTAAELLSIPALKSKAAAYGAGEQELRMEIRKQYPTISLGPAFTREEGANRLGLGAELDIPAWNRNRGGIATAKAERAIKKQEYVAQWRSLLTDSAALASRQTLAQQHCSAEHQRVLQLKGAANTQEKLYAIGETKLPQVAESRHEIYQRELSYLDCLGELLSIQSEIEALRTPNK